MKLSKSLLLLLFCCFCLPLQAKVTLPKIFSDNLVLQRDRPVLVWGWANAGENLTVSFAQQTATAQAGADGKWSVKLKPEKAGGAFTLTVTGENTVTVKNIMVGEVWLCGGQSNMEWTVGQSLNAAQEMAAANNPNIRHIRVAKSINSAPQEDISSGTWQVSTPATVGDFSGVGYFFAKNLYPQLKVPIGLINASWGGTNIETWISREGLENSAEFKEMMAQMPRIDIAALGQIMADKKRKHIETLQGATLASFKAEDFLKLDFDDTGLPTINQPQLWESQALGQIDGVIWLRKVITLTADESKQTGFIEVAQVDDLDHTFINGVEIGSTPRYDAKRKYAVPSGVLREGQNVIVVKVTDTGGGGGIYGDPAELRLVLGDKSISLAGAWKAQAESIQNGLGENELPSLAYNAMISPLAPYALRGVLWYQGESNAGRAYQYRLAFPLLINDWRHKWGQEFPFYFVQLATFGTAGDSNAGSDWAELREAQTLTLKVPKTGMVVTTDIGDPKDVHPRNKQEVGRRLAAVALHGVYQQKLVSSGPSFKALKIAGQQAVISFDNVGDGLATPDNGAVLGFEIAGSDQVFYPATATLKGEAVIVTSDKVPAPIAVRFGWRGDASANNLFNRAGFPAVPFRTDAWKTITQGAKYKITALPD